VVVSYADERYYARYSQCHRESGSFDGRHLQWHGHYHLLGRYGQSADGFRFTYGHRDIDEAA